MYFRLMGTAAGGGFPQWNCSCSNCRTARLHPPLRRAHACAALSDDGQDWYLLNAPPDVAGQIEEYEDLHPGPGIRQTKIKGVILTDAELDHTIGLLVLREQSHLRVFATPSVQRTLQIDFPVAPMLRNYARLEWQSIMPGTEFNIGAMRIRPYSTGTKTPKYRLSDEPGSACDQVIGLSIESSRNSVVYAPSIEYLTSEFCNAIAKSDYVFIDGTFYHGNELVDLGVSGRSARECGHLPLFGEDGIIENLQSVHEKDRNKTVYLIHVNNSNPIIIGDRGEPGLPQWIQVAPQGFCVPGAVANGRT